MTVTEILKSAGWTCQWTCPLCAEVNTVHKHELPPGIQAPDDLLHDSLMCHLCHTNLGSWGAVQPLAYDTRPSGFPRVKALVLHLWPDAV